MCVSLVSGNGQRRQGARKECQCQMLRSLARAQLPLCMPKRSHTYSFGGIVCRAKITRSYRPITRNQSQRELLRIHTCAEAAKTCLCVCVCLCGWYECVCAKETKIMLMLTHLQFEQKGNSSNITGIEVRGWGEAIAICLSGFVHVLLSFGIHSIELPSLW